MRMITLKKQSEVKLEGVKVEYQIHDNKLEAVIITDAKGQSIRIIKSDSYSSELKVMMQQDYDIETHVFVEGELFGNKISKSFGKKEYDAERKASDYAYKINSKLDFGEEEAVKVVEKEVKVEYSSGNVVDDSSPITF